MSRIWIVRKGTGAAIAAPSPQEIRIEEGFEIWNLVMDGVAQVEFTNDHIDLITPHAATIPPRSRQVFALHPPVGLPLPLYLEYEISLQCGHVTQSVEGGSRPGIIIIP